MTKKVVPLATATAPDVKAERERLFELSLDMMCISSSDGYFKELNPAFSRTLGWSIEEMLQRPFIDFVHPDDRAATLREVERQVAAGESVLHFENRYLHKDGSWRVLSWRSVPQPGGFMYASARDVTEERRIHDELVKARQDADRASRAKSAFLATMSHEIRTPLNGVLGMVELLALSELSEEQRASVDVVRRSGETLKRIIDDILEFSKIEAGKLEVQPEVASIADIITGVREVFGGTAAAKGLRLEQRVDPRLSPAVMVDPVRLQQILNNFIGNALKFTARGGISISADLVERREGVDHVRIAVQDTGIGIAPELQASLFEPFTQAERETTRRFGGTGLGLTISRRLAELMGGTVSMRSERGVGTTLTLTLPLPIADPARLPSRDAARFTEQLSLAPRRTPPNVTRAQEEGTLVLVVDDHPTNQTVLSHQLNVLGFAAEVASSGAEALQMWDKHRYGAIFADCSMPVMDGYQLARRIRQLEAARGLPRTPIIACTANAMRGEAAICQAAGMDDYLSKPVELAELEKKLARWLPAPEA